MTTTQRIILGLSIATVILLFLMPPVTYGSGRDWLWHSPTIEWKAEHRELFFWALFTVLLLVATHPKRV